MVMLPHVQQDQEESVWIVLQDRCQEMILEDQVQRDKGPAAGVPGGVPHNTETLKVLHTVISSDARRSLKLS